MSQKDRKHRSREEELLSGIYSPMRKELIMKKPEKLTVGNRLRRERYLRRWSQEKMAAYLGISPSYLGAIERGERAISVALQIKIHRLLHLSYDFLLDGISLSGEAISQYVHESSDYSTQHNLDVLLGVCTDEELENCYELVHTYLVNHRRRVYNDKLPSPGPLPVHTTQPLPSGTDEAAAPGTDLKQDPKNSSLEEE